MAPKRKEAPAYYEARDLLAECFGLNDDDETLEQAAAVDPYLKENWGQDE